MKLSEYIKKLQELKDKCGDVKVKLNKTYECFDLSINDTYSDQKIHIMTKVKILLLSTVISGVTIKNKPSF